MGAGPGKVAELEENRRTCEEWELWTLHIDQLAYCQEVCLVEE